MAGGNLNDGFINFWNDLGDGVTFLYRNAQHWDTGTVPRA